MGPNPIQNLNEPIMAILREQDLAFSHMNRSSRVSQPRSSRESDIDLEELIPTTSFALRRLLGKNVFGQLSESQTEEEDPYTIFAAIPVEHPRHASPDKSFSSSMGSEAPAYPTSDSGESETLFLS